MTIFKGILTRNPPIYLRTNDILNIKKPPIAGGLKVSGENFLNYNVRTPSAPPNAEKIAETDAVANSHHAAVAAALRVSSAWRCA